MLDGLVEPRDVIARVVHGPRRRAIRERAHHVGAPERRRIASGLARRALDQPLHGVDAFEAADSAIDVDRHGVGEGALEPEMDRRDGVDPGHHPLHVEDDRHRHAGRDVGAEVLDGVHAQAGDAAILIERELASEPMVARLSVGDEALGSARGPLDRAPETASRPGERDVLGIGLDLRAEAAADVTGDAAHAIARDAEDAREVGRELMHALQRGVDRVASGGGVPGGEGRARLHEAGDQAVVDQREPGDVGHRRRAQRRD